MESDTRPIVERLQLARAAMAKLTSSRHPVMVSIPPDRDDADMLICRACEDAVAEIVRLTSALSAANARVKELEAIVAKLPRTTDGVPVVPGVELWFRFPDCRIEPDTASRFMVVDGCWHINDEPHGFWYSTHEAARAGKGEGHGSR